MQNIHGRRLDSNLQASSQNCEKRFCASSHLTVRMERLSSCQTDFDEIWYLCFSEMSR